MSKSYYVLLTSAISFGGSISKAGEVIEVNENEMKNLIHRGKGELHSEQPFSADDANPDIMNMNKAALVELALERGVENASKLTKDQLIEAIKDVEKDED